MAKLKGMLWFLFFHVVYIMTTIVLQLHVNNDSNSCMYCYCAFSQNARQGGLTLSSYWIHLEVSGQVTFRMSGILLPTWSVSLKLDQTALE